MKRFVLALGIVLFIFGYFQLREYYTLVELTPEQRQFIWSVGLASNTVQVERENGTKSEIILHIGKFALVRR